MSGYDHLYMVVSVDGHTITDWADATDALQVNYSDAEGTLTKGIGRSIFVASNKDGGQLVLQLMQNSEDSKFLQDRLKSQKQLKNHSPIQCYIKDTVNKDEIKLIRGWILTKPNLVRGNGHNNMVWTIDFEAEESNYGTGK